MIVHRGLAKGGDLTWLAHVQLVVMGTAIAATAAAVIMLIVMVGEILMDY